MKKKVHLVLTGCKYAKPSYVRIHGIEGSEKYDVIARDCVRVTAKFERLVNGDDMYVAGLLKQLLLREFSNKRQSRIQ